MNRNATLSTGTAGLHAELLERLQNHGLFVGVDASLRELIAAELKLIRLAAGQWLFRQGDRGDSMFVLDSGRVDVVLRNETGNEAIIDALLPGAIIGEMALLSGRPRAAGIRAVVDCQLIQLSNEGYDTICVTHGEIADRVAEFALTRFRRTQMAGVLPAFFGQLDAQALHDIQGQLEWRHVEVNEFICRQGDPGQSMFIVVNGRLRIVSRHPDGEIQFATEIGRGQTTGEFSLLTGEARSADIYAMRESHLLVLSAKAFERISAQYPQIGLQIARDIARRIQSGSSSSSSAVLSALSVTVIPVTEGVDSAAFARGLAHQMAIFGPTLQFDAAEFDARFGKEGASITPPGGLIDIPILGWLTQLEETHRFMIYVADATMTPWTQRCLRHSDRIVFVADPKQKATLSPIEEAIATRYPYLRTELLLLYSDHSAGPRGTGNWLANRRTVQHHHIRAGETADFRRFIRRLTGRPVGLVLSGGAVRGFAHVGVYRALREAGIEIDLIGGTSMGALAGGLIASDLNYEELLAYSAQFSSRKTLLDYTFPAVAIFETKKISTILQKIFGDKAIEDLYRPFFCVSSNLTTMRPFVHDRGSLWQAVRASTAIPGVFAPVNHQGDLLVDGGVMNNMPVDLMRENCEQGQVIAVDVSPRRERAEEWNFGSSISGWQVLGNRLNPFARAKSVPGLSDTIMRSMTVNSTYRLQQSRMQADLLIQLDTSGTNILDWDAYREMIDLGYKTAKPLIANWLEGME